MFIIKSVFDSSKPSTCVCTIILIIIQNNSINEEVTIVLVWFSFFLMIFSENLVVGTI